MTSTTGAPLRAEVKMTDGWQVLEEAIPRGESDAIGEMMNCSGQTVRSWRNEPENNENYASGRRSPLDQILKLINAVYARNPEGAELIVRRVVDEIVSLRRIHGRDESLSISEVESELNATIERLRELKSAVVGAKGDGRRNRD